MNTEDARQRGDHAPRFVPKEMLRWLHLHVEDLDRTYFDRTSDFENRTPLRKFYSLGEIGSRDHRVTANDILGLCIRTIPDYFPPTINYLPGGLQRMSGIFDVTLLAELFKPRYPLLRMLLALFARGECLPS